MGSLKTYNPKIEVVRYEDPPEEIEFVYFGDLWKSSMDFRNLHAIVQRRTGCRFLLAKRKKDFWWHKSSDIGYGDLIVLTCPKGQKMGLSHIDGISTFEDRYKVFKVMDSSKEKLKLEIMNFDFVQREAKKKPMMSANPLEKAGLKSEDMELEDVLDFINNS